MSPSWSAPLASSDPLPQYCGPVPKHSRYAMLCDDCSADVPKQFCLLGKFSKPERVKSSDLQILWIFMNYEILMRITRGSKPNRCPCPSSAIALVRAVSCFPHGPKLRQMRQTGLWSQWRDGKVRRNPHQVKGKGMQRSWFSGLSENREPK